MRKLGILIAISSYLVGVKEKDLLDQSSVELFGGIDVKHNHMSFLVYAWISFHNLHFHGPWVELMNHKEQICKH